MPYQQSPWSLADLFPSMDSPKLDESFERLEKRVAEFEKFRDDLKPDIDPEHFMTILDESEQMTRLAYRLYGFAGLSFAANTQDQAALALQARVQQFLAEMNNRALFFELWWKNLDEASTQRLLSISGDIRYYL